jgi:hypothetical protein
MTKKLNLKNRESFGIFWNIQLATWNLLNSLIIRQTCVKNCPCGLGWGGGGRYLEQIRGRRILQEYCYRAFVPPKKNPNDSAKVSIVSVYF